MASRNTVQQKVVAEQLKLLGNHPTANEVYRAVACEIPTISRATVYRALNKMVDSGDAMRVIAGPGAERFDHRADPHYHVMCVSCGKVEDVEAAPFDERVEIDHAAASFTSGYEVLGHDLVFKGICPTCQLA